MFYTNGVTTIVRDTQLYNYTVPFVQIILYEIKVHDTQEYARLCGVAY